ncbi:hypothetical protein BBP40_001715 [Aspergillus hancockii]|nr:hypothetical protein BBP40_001715 [Aspergillus hancockii]
MVTFHILLLACLGLSLAAPQDRTWTCTNSNRQLRYSQNSAISASHHAPISDGKTKRSYPHWFTNGYDGDGKLKKSLKKPLVQFPVADCNKPPKHSKNGEGKTDHYLREFPVYQDGHQYNFDKKPKEDPGEARIIYTYPHKTF